MDWHWEVDRNYRQIISAVSGVVGCLYHSIVVVSWSWCVAMAVLACRWRACFVV